MSHTKEIGTTFTKTHTYVVVEDVNGLNTRRSCAAPCAFNRKGLCFRALSETGECKAFYRDDKKSVYFEEIYWYSNEITIQAVKNMTRSVGSRFEDGEYTYEVVEDTEKLNSRIKCQAPCAFKEYINKARSICHGSLSKTGDCKSFYRDDKKSVYFKEVYWYGITESNNKRHPQQQPC